MVTGELKSKIDRVWDSFWTGGISNPLTVIEQITYLLFIKRLDELQTLKENKANRLGEPIEDHIFSPEQRELRWQYFKNQEASVMYQTVAEKVFPFIKNMHTDQESAYAKYMKDAVFMIPTPNLLEKVVTMISDIPMDDRDTKGDVYEYLLSKIATAGQNGQFRTPRHIIKMMVEMLKPQPTDVICDPACGTAGFLVAASEYLREHNPELFHDEELRHHFNHSMYYGNDFDVSMIRIAVMNMTLHGIENPRITNKDALTESNRGNTEMFDVILANPPFKGSLDYEQVANDLLTIVKTKKTELLFLALILRTLKIGGRCAVIVPDGVLFDTTAAHKSIRRALVDGNKLDAVISMPSGVFKPYTGIATAVLFFTKTNSGGTDKVWFYDMDADGFSLDDKRQELDMEKHASNNIPDIINRFNYLQNEVSRPRTEQSFLVPVDEIRAKGYLLAINKYRLRSEKVHINYPNVSEHLSELRSIDELVAKRMNDLKDLLQ